MLLGSTPQSSPGQTLFPANLSEDSFVLTPTSCAIPVPLNSVASLRTFLRSGPIRLGQRRSIVLD